MAVFMTELLRYRTSKSSTNHISLKEYVKRMKEGQKDIYYHVNGSTARAAASPEARNLREEGFEVLYVVDWADATIIARLKEFKDKKLQRAVRHVPEIETPVKKTLWFDLAAGEKEEKKEERNDDDELREEMGGKE